MAKSANLSSFLFYSGGSIWVMSIVDEDISGDPFSPVLESPNCFSVPFMISMLQLVLFVSLN